MHDSLELLKLYTPTLFDCVTRNKKTAKSVRMKYDERWNSMKNAVAEKGVFSAKTCIFDLLWKASEKVEDAETFLIFINRMAHNALSNIGATAHRQIEKLIITMITSFGEQSSEYKNHFAELAVIAKLVKGGFELLTVEKSLPNGKSIDFEVSKEGIITLLEIYNIDFEIDKIHNSNDFRIFLENRLIKKLNKKFEGINQFNIGCTIIPVLWGDIMSLVHFREALDYFKQVTIIGPFMMVAHYRNSKNGHIAYNFGSVEQFLLRVERRKNNNH